jgi:hypothetical protein
MKGINSQLPKNQTQLHQKLKDYYLSKFGGIQEVTLKVNGNKYRIDVYNRDSNTAYEIQRSNFGGHFSKKIRGLLQSSELNIVIVHPIATNRRVSRMDGELLGVRNYKMRSNVYSMFESLVRFNVEFIPQRMEIDVVFIKEHVFKEFIEFYGRARRKYKIIQRDLLSIEKVMNFRTKSDFVNILPPGLPNTFTNHELAEKLSVEGSQRRIQRISGIITYSLCRLGILTRVGTRGRAHEFSIKISGK